jgi:hypothetical protein
MKKYLFTLLAGAWCALAHAQQPTQTVKGRVIDTESQQPVIGANVIITSLNPIIGGATDTEGNFRIENVPLAAILSKLPALVTTTLPFRKSMWARERK